MKKVALLCLGAASIALMLAPSAQAHSLTKKKARSALNAVAAEVTPTVAPAIAAKLPGATISKTSVGLCDIVKKGHRADCAIIFNIQGASTGETECALEARVQFKNRKSRELKISLAPVVVCFFPVPLE